jgi:hypothetical protein
LCLKLPTALLKLGLEKNNDGQPYYN